MKLTVKAGRGEKMHLHIDGEYFLTVDNGYLAELGIYNGMDVDCEDIEKLRVNIGARRAYNKAVDLLSRRDHSRKELLDKLRQKGYGEYAVEAYIPGNDNYYALTSARVEFTIQKAIKSISIKQEEMLLESKIFPIPIR